MGLYKRGNTWWYSFTINGIREQGTTKEKTKIAAQQRFVEIFNERKQEIIYKKLSFSKIVDIYLTLNHFNTLSKSTKKNFKSQLRKALPYFDKKSIFKKENIYAYVEYLIKDEGLQSTTVRRKDMVMLSSILTQVKKAGFITINPFTDIDLSSYKKTNNRIRFLTLKEREVIINNCKGNFLDYIQFAIETGLRQGEQLNLSWDRIYLDRKEIYIIKTKTGANRTVPLSPLAYNILKRRITEEKPFSFTEGILGDKYRKLRKKLNLKDLTWHDLRHTFATYAIKGIHNWQQGNAMPITKLQKWLGHKDIKMTMRYAHLDTSDLKTEVRPIC